MKKKLYGLIMILFICCFLSSTVMAKEKDVPKNALAAEKADTEDPQWGRAHGYGVIEENKSDSKSISGNTSGYKHNSRFNSGYTIKTGIDVSKFNGSINWASVRADDTDFAFVRVGARGYGGGTLLEDDAYRTNLNGAISAGIPVGVYFFSQAITIAEAEEEARFVCSRLSGFNISLPVVIDFEYANVGSGNTGRLYNAHLSNTEATNICKAFCRTVQSYGYQPMVYANKDMLTYDLYASSISSDYPVWLANYTYETDYSGDYNFWQFRSNGSVSGISGSVDIDFWYDNGNVNPNGYYDIIFNGNGATKGKMSTMKGLDPEMYYNLYANKFERKGYEFKNWNLKKNGSGKSYKNKQIIIDLAKGSSSVTLYAQWKPVKYTITYVLNGGTNDSKNPTSYTAETDTITFKDAKKTGYIFKGWFKDKWLYEKVTKQKKGSTGNKKYYAKFKAIHYTVKYNGNGADSGSILKQDCTYDKVFTASKNKFKKGGYVFVEWNTKKDGSGISVKAGADCKNLTAVDGQTVTLYAIWQAKNYNIKYYLDGGVNSKYNPASYTVEDTVVFKNPKKTGYIFKGWYTDAKFTKKITSIQAGSTGAVSVYAKWEAIQYSIEFYGNEADEGEMDAMVCVYGTEYTLLSNLFEKEGYRFVGWNTAEDGSGKSYEDGQTIVNLSKTNGAVIKLYAQWEVIEEEPPVEE